jgi:hypothetical protein
MIDQDRDIMTFSDDVTHVTILSRRRAAGYSTRYGINLESHRISRISDFLILVVISINRVVRKIRLVRDLFLRIYMIWLFLSQLCLNV